jgi:hypothetical protein
MHIQSYIITYDIFHMHIHIHIHIYIYIDIDIDTGIEMYIDI